MRGPSLVLGFLSCNSINAFEIYHECINQYSGIVLEVVRICIQGFYAVFLSVLEPSLVLGLLWTCNICTLEIYHEYVI